MKLAARRPVHKLDADRIVSLTAVDGSDPEARRRPVQRAGAPELRTVPGGDEHLSIAVLAKSRCALGFLAVALPLGTVPSWRTLAVMMKCAFASPSPTS